jgi:hypothetical protein
LPTCEPGWTNGLTPHFFFIVAITPRKSKFCEIRRKCLIAKRAFVRLSSPLLLRYITGAGLGLLTYHAACADVLQIESEGAVKWRRGTGEVTWLATASAASSTLPTAPFLPKLASTPSSFAPMVAQAAAKHGVDTRLLEALVWQESRWNPSAVSPKGAKGLGQLMPATARDLGVDPRDPAGNLDGAARYLRQQLDLFGGNVPLALAAYNAGAKRVIDAGGIPAIAETRAYVRAITDHIATSSLSPLAGVQSP